MNNSAKKELFERIVSKYPDLSPKKRRVADFILKDYKNLFLMTAKELARTCSVSEPTITRFVNDLGFSGYGEFEKYVKSLLHIELTSVERMLKTSHTPDLATTLQTYVQNAVFNLENLAESISESELKNVARAIHEAQAVIVAGYRASSTLATYFSYMLKKIKNDVTVDTDFSSEILDRIALHGPSTLLFVIGFPRYPRRTIELIEYAKNFNLTVIGLSDTPKSPIVTLAHQFIIIDMEGISFVDPFAHIIAFLGALVHEIAFIDKNFTIERLSKIEDGVKIREEFYSLEDEGIADYNPLEFPSHPALWPGAAPDRGKDEEH